jgi:hypothetical protein
MVGEITYMMMSPCVIGSSNERTARNEIAAETIPVAANQHPAIKRLIVVSSSGTN